MVAEAPAVLMFTSCSVPEAGYLRLQGVGSPGVTYTLQVSTNLVEWSNHTNVVAGTDGEIDYTEPTTPHGPACFYRL